MWLVWLMWLSWLSLRMVRLIRSSALGFLHTIEAPDVLMAWRKRRHMDPRGRSVPNNVEHLAFKYMMCKVESSTDSESEISPRWSDTSTMGCGSSAAESDCGPHTVPLVPKSSGRHGCSSVFLDPYDGSSEDSDTSMDAQYTRQSVKGALCWCVARNRRFNHQPHQHQPAPDQTKTSETDKLNHSISYDENSNFHAAMSLSDGDESFALEQNGGDVEDVGRPCLKSGWSYMMDRSSERSPSPSSNLHKRKCGLPGAELLERAHRKRQCVVNMELDEDLEDTTPKKM
ncbi:uncharacterized protein LOC129411451 isoform X2 [Boleophthalmus pectinirostris]|uniref:uncharacterized protein LOC129411451 isoform X2 n=1 Tax=Boleophthalmus pectinirostris TaxID=150288 RepID=UPI00242C0B52|nr:uncharacterized protein LOC129411451 isoform X2 [Boleophthalmus pectinirostris]